MNATLTPRQLQVLKYIRDYRGDNGYSPTMQEIGDKLQVTKVTVFKHVEALVFKGLLSRGRKHESRTLQIVPGLALPDDSDNMKILLKTALLVARSGGCDCTCGASLRCKNHWGEWIADAKKALGMNGE